MDSRRYWTLLLLATVMIGFGYACEFLANSLAYRIKVRYPQLNRHRISVATPAPIIPPEGAELIGTTPKDWTVSDWINSPALTLAALRGKVVLVRWWTSPGCPYCAASAPALNELWQRYHAQGLVVIGMYHHKAETPLTRNHVASEVKRLGFEFPVAIDADWATLHRWWLDNVPAIGRGPRPQRSFTSVTFLLDRKGVVRFVHPGGTIEKGDPGYTALIKAIDAALAQQ